MPPWTSDLPVSVFTLNLLSLSAFRTPGHFYIGTKFQSIYIWERLAFDVPFFCFYSEPIWHPQFNILFHFPKSSAKKPS